MSNFQLAIKSYVDPDYKHVISIRPTQTELGRIEDGVNINLNHDEYFTVIEPAEEEK